VVPIPVTSKPKGAAKENSFSACRNFKKMTECCQPPISYPGLEIIWSRIHDCFSVKTSDNIDNRFREKLFSSARSVVRKMAKKI
jgi:hypothetical protein